MFLGDKPVLGEWFIGNLRMLGKGILDITINNKKISVTVGETILQAAARLDIEIPNICYKEGLGHINSCMICMVKDLTADKFIPACSTKVTDGMVIETDSEELRVMRREGLELLLSEHIGDCEAPCALACPAGLDIPLLTRQIKSGLLPDAVKTVKKCMEFPKVLCKTCDAPCERVCRRGRIDQSVSIRLLVLYIAGMYLDGDEISIPEVLHNPKKRFNSYFGKLLPRDKAVFLHEASEIGRIDPAVGDSGRFTADEACKESERCLHCDCRKLEHCKLRDYATEYSAKQVAFKGTERGAFAKCDQHDSVIFEEGKCIKCGICVAITKKFSDATGLEFCGRGYDVKVSVPFDELLSVGLKNAAKECVESCPTGALAWKMMQMPE